MKTYQKWLLGFAGLGLLIGTHIATTQGSTLQGFQGGTGIATSTASNDGKCLTQASSSPFLLWSIGACGSGGGSVSTSSPITVNNFPYWATISGGLSGTSTITQSGGKINIASNASATSFGVTGTGGAGYITLIAQSSNPSSPPAGTLLIHSATTQGFTRMEQDNEAATNLVYGRDSVFIAKNTSGGTINPGQPVYISGSTGNVPNIALAQANATATLPEVGIALDTIGINNFGQIMTWGIISSINTSAFSTGDTVYVSSTTAGALTNVRPTTPNFVQKTGVVLVSGVGNGSILVETAPFIGNMETGSSFTGLYRLAGSFNASGTIYQAGIPVITTSTYNVAAQACGGTNKVSAISATGTITCTTDQSGGGGLTTSTVGGYQPNNVAYFTNGNTLEATSTFNYVTSTQQLVLGHTSSSLKIGDKFNNVLNSVTNLTGGTITYSAGKAIHTFNASGTFIIPSTSTITSVDVLVIGGGGGGGRGAAATGGAGGGGAGGFTYVTSTAVTPGNSYAITVGLGGAGATSDHTNGGSGTTSTAALVSTITSKGGGGGAQATEASSTPGVAGASGGGGAQGGLGGAGTLGQGNNGGTGATGGSGEGGGGGGGASAVGGDGNNSTGAAGNGGAGTVSTISGASVTYAGGGGGGRLGVGTQSTGGAGGGGFGGNSNGAGQNASSSSGGGGGGGADTSGGNGGTGVVIISYSLPYISDVASSTYSLAVGGDILVGGASSTVSSCGTSPIVQGGKSGKVIIGGGTVTSCTITFSSPYQSVPACILTENTNNVSTWCVPTASNIVINSGSSMGGDTISYWTWGL